VDTSLLKPAAATPRAESSGEGVVQPRRAESNRDAGAFARELDSSTEKPKRVIKKPADNQTGQQDARQSGESRQAEKRPQEQKQGSRLALVARQTSPALNVLTAAPGRMPSPEVASLAARSEFIQGAISSSEISKFLATPVAVESLLRDLGLNSGFMTELKALGLVEGQAVAPKDLLSQLGIDVGQVSANLQDLKQKVQAAEKSLGMASGQQSDFELTSQEKDPGAKKLRDLAAAGAAGMTLSAPQTQQNVNAEVSGGPSASQRGPAPVKLAEAGVAKTTSAVGTSGKASSEISAQGLGLGVAVQQPSLFGATKVQVPGASTQLASGGEGTWTSLDPWKELKLGSNVQRTDFATTSDPIESLIRSQILPKAASQSVTGDGGLTLASASGNIEGLRIESPAQSVSEEGLVSGAGTSFSGVAPSAIPSNGISASGFSGVGISAPTAFGAQGILQQSPTGPAALAVPLAREDASASLPKTSGLPSGVSDVKSEFVPEQRYDLREILTPQDLKSPVQKTSLNAIDLMDRLEASLRLSGRGVEGLLERRAGEGSEKFFDESSEDLVSSEISGESSLATDALGSARGDFSSLVNLGGQPVSVDMTSGQGLALAEENRAELLQKLVDKAQMVIKEGGGSVRIDLGSPEMGRLELAVNLNQDRVDVKILTASEHVREMLNREMPRLRESLAVQNLNLGSVEVGVGGGQHQFSQSGHEQQTGSQWNGWQGGGFEGFGRGSGAFDGRRRDESLAQVAQGTARISRIPAQMARSSVISAPGRIQVFA
jgi:hypothetical protein